jgi:hypothetical protein
MNPRLRSVLDLMVPSAREEAGYHEYDGQVQDFSDEAVSKGLAQLGGQPLEDPHDEAHLAAFEAGLRVLFDDLAVHHTNPLTHLSNLDISCYVKEYAPKEERLAATRRHVANWPEAIDVAIDTLDRVPAPTASALLPAIQGLSAALSDEWPESGPARQAHHRLVTHLAGCAADGPPDAAIGEAALAKLMGTIDASQVDLGRLEEQADAELVRLREMLDDACASFRPGTPTTDVVNELLADHATSAELIPDARERTNEVIEFCREQGLLTHLDGECEVGLAPEARRWGVAMLTWSAPHEPDAPSKYDITPPEDSWPADKQREWLEMFNATSMTVITAHEVAPGHFAHGRALRRAPGEIRQSLFGYAFAEGWAHYGEELMLEVGFRGDDPRFQAGVALEALCRLCRLSSAIGLHRGTMTVEDSVALFRSQSFLPEPVARSEAQRGTFDPGYGMYTWGKWEILRAREAAKSAWGSGFSLRRFHDALMELGSPPLGLIGTAVERG